MASISVFLLFQDESKHGILDRVHREWTEYQTEIISEDFYMKQDTGKFSSRGQPSYWQEAYGVTGSEYEVEEFTFIRIDKCWLKIFTYHYFLNQLSLATQIKFCKV